jgi:hypothetical protein
MKLLQYLYSRFYQLMVAVGNGDIASFASILFMTFFFGVNGLTFFEILDISGHGIRAFSGRTAIIILLCISVILYFLLVHNGKSARILNQYEGETKKDKVKGRIAIIFYIILSIAILISTFLIMGIKNRG